MHKLDDYNKNAGKKVMNLNINNDKLGKDKNSSNDDELIIITPRLNKNDNGFESYINEITDERKKSYKKREFLSLAKI